MSEVGDNSGSVNASHLRAIIERIERVQSEIDDLTGDKSEIYKEAKSAGFDTAIMRKIVAMRRQDLEKRKEQETILDLYLSALGMLPLFDGG